MPRLAALVTVLALAASPPEIVKPEGMPKDFGKALEQAESLELYSLEPMGLGEGGEGSFHGWKELGRTTLRGDARTKLVASFAKGVAEQDQNAAAACVFSPRHGFRVRSGGKTYDLVVCFQCYAVRSFRSGEKEFGFFGVSRSPADTFNKALKEAKVKLPAQSPD